MEALKPPKGYWQVRNGTVKLGDVFWLRGSEGDGHWQGGDLYALGKPVSYFHAVARKIKKGK